MAYAYVYMVASKCKGTLYVGVTSNLQQRIWQHKNGTYDGFTRKYGVDELVWYEGFDDIRLAIQREKQLKHSNRNWKIRLIEESNPLWDDLSATI